MSKSETKKQDVEPQDAPLPPKIDGYILWSVPAPPSVMFFDKKDGEAWLERHVWKSGETVADVRLVRVSEVARALEDEPERKSSTKK